VTRMTPEREAEIRDAVNDGRLRLGGMAGDLLAALDAERKAHAETRAMYMENARLGEIDLADAKARHEAATLDARAAEERASDADQALSGMTAAHRAEKARADALEARLGALVALASKHEQALAHAQVIVADAEAARVSEATARIAAESKASTAERERGLYEAKLAALVELADKASTLIGWDGGEARRDLDACLSDLDAAAKAYRDRVRAETLEEAAQRADNRWGEMPVSYVADKLRAMASEKGGAK
jgi:hypothetical protein